MNDTGANRRTIIGAGALIAGAGAFGAAADARAQAGAADWTPAIEAQDAWLDKPGSRHRLVFDTTSAKAAETAVFYADNFYTANKSGYGIEPAALAVVIIMRHASTPFGFNDSIWQKYGAAFAKQLKLEGDDAVRAAKGNTLLSASTPAAPGKGDDKATLATLATKGARFAVCAMATHAIAQALAKQSGGSAEDVENDLKANLIPGALMVPAGVVAINRAQEHGYAFAYVD